jgi:hypothetical protein
MKLEFSLHIFEKYETIRMLRYLLYPEDIGITFLRNIGNY